MWNLLGLRANALEGRLRLIRPCLPLWLDWLELRGLRVGAARVDLRFERTAPGGPARASWEVREGDLAVECLAEPAAPDSYI